MIIHNSAPYTTSLAFINTTIINKLNDEFQENQIQRFLIRVTTTPFKTGAIIQPEEEGPGPLHIPLAVALDAGLKDEGVGVEVVVRGDGAILTAAAGVLHHNRHWQRDAAKVL